MKSKIKNLFAVVLFAAAIFTGCKEDPILPTVVTKDATGIKGDYATLHGEIRNSTDEENYKCGFFYDVSAEMSSPKDIEAKSDARFFAKVTGLLSNTTYYYKAYIRCSEGLIEGETLTFTSQAAGPSVETRPASDVTGNGATLNAAIPSNGGSEITSCGFYYSTSESMSNKATAQFAGTPDSLFSVPVSNLHGNTTYYYKAFAKNVFGTAEGEIMRFTTGIGTPTVQTGEATNIAAYSATLVGNVTSDGGATVTERGFVYGTSASDLSQAVQSGSGMGSFTKAIAGLTASTTYYYKAYATNSAGTAYGEAKQFTTTISSYIDGVFSISSTKQVYFSRGNLQYQASSRTWRFAENQYDIIGYLNSYISSSYTGWIDLFGWGTGSNPINSSTDYNNYSQFTDWGNNAISNGGNQGGLWRTLTKNEWSYLLSDRTNAASLVGKATVNGDTGLVFLPDNWTLPSGCSFTSGTSSDFTANIYTTSQWATMESAGAVFLPAAGYRIGTSVYSVGSYGHYWSSTGAGINCAQFFDFDGVQWTPNNRGSGRSVRLVRVVQN